MISARGKHFVVAFDECLRDGGTHCRLLEVWDITEVISSPPEATVCLSSPSWSIRLGGRLGIDSIMPKGIRSIPNEYQMLFYGINGNEVIEVIFLKA